MPFLCTAVDLKSLCTPVPSDWFLFSSSYIEVSVLQFQVIGSCALVHIIESLYSSSYIEVPVLQFIYLSSELQFLVMGSCTSVYILESLYSVSSCWFLYSSSYESLCSSSQVVGSCTPIHIRVPVLQFIYLSPCTQFQVVGYCTPVHI